MAYIHQSCKVSEKVTNHETSYRFLIIFTALNTVNTLARCLYFLIHKLSMYINIYCSFVESCTGKV